MPPPVVRSSGFTVGDAGEYGIPSPDILSDDVNGGIAVLYVSAASDRIELRFSVMDHRRM